MESDKITLKLKDGSSFSLTKKAAELSELLKGAMNDYPNDTEIPIAEVEKKTLEAVIEYLNHYEGKNPPEIEKPLTKGELSDILSKIGGDKDKDSFPFEYIEKFNLEALTNLCVAANFMGINPLLDLCCAKIAYLCKDKDEDEILKTFGITETFSEEEKQKIREENSWIEENI